MLGRSIEIKEGYFIDSIFDTLILTMSSRIWNGMRVPSSRGTLLLGLACLTLMWPCTSDGKFPKGTWRYGV